MASTTVAAGLTLVLAGAFLAACEARAPAERAPNERPTTGSRLRERQAQAALAHAQARRAPNEVLCRRESTGEVDEQCVRAHVALDIAQEAYTRERTCLDPYGSIDRKCLADKTRLDGELSRIEDK